MIWLRMSCMLLLSFIILVSDYSSGYHFCCLFILFAGNCHFLFSTFNIIVFNYFMIMIYIYIYPVVIC